MAYNERVQTVDLAARLERSLSPADLRRSGKALYRKLSKGLGREAMLSPEPFKRIGSDGRTLLVRLRPAGGSSYSGDPYLLSATRGRLRVLALPVGESFFGPWRRRGDRIVGEVDQVSGNTQWPCVLVLNRRGGVWRVVAGRSAEGEETHEVRFFGKGIARLVVSTRSYDFRRLSQPHAGPLLLRDTTWEVRGRTIAAVASRLRRTPLYDFDRFCDAVVEGDGRTARSLCAPRLYARACVIVRRSKKAYGDSLTVFEPNSIEYDTGRFLGFWDYGKGAGVRVYFQLDRSGAGWRIARLRRPEEFPKPKDVG